MVVRLWVEQICIGGPIGVENPLSNKIGYKLNMCVGYN